MATPNVGIITCIAEAHLGGPGLGSLAAIATAKLELFEHLSPQGICILNQDDAWLNQLAPAIIQQRPCVRVGTAQNNDIQIVDIRGETAGTTMQLRIDSQYHNCWIPLIGRHQAYNSALALAAAWTQNIDIVAAINQLKHLKPIQHRLSILHFPEQSFTLIDDCYNANPGSMKAALATALQYQQGRLLMVCGDMLELGIHAETLHIELGRQIAEDAKAHMLWAVGDYAKYVCDAAQTKGTQSFAFTSDVPIKKLTEAICTILQPGDVLLVKGSRGARLERLVESIQFTLNKAEK
jgi:UDP-N-acetylmuramoyl-tripeptide--D-alanyl-D-alanine ligase